MESHSHFGQTDMTTVQLKAKWWFKKNAYSFQESQWEKQTCIYGQNLALGLAHE